MEKKRSIQDTLLAKILRVLCDLMILNWLWILCSLPIFTIGPATCALYRVIIKLNRGEPISVTGTFFQAFTSNFKQAVPLGLLGLGGLVIAVVDIYFALTQTGIARPLFITVGTIVLLLTLLYQIYIYPLQATFQNSKRNQIKNAFAMAFCSPGNTLMIVMILAFPWIGAVCIPSVFINVFGFVYIMMAFSAPVYLACGPLLKVFGKFVDLDEVLPKMVDMEEEEMEEDSETEY